MRIGAHVAVSVIALVVIPSAEGVCPDQTALKFLKHEIAYERTEESPTLKGLSVIHLNVWMRGQITGFYVREPLKDAIPTIRMSYLFGADGPVGGGTCPLAKDWQECVEGFADLVNHTNDAIGTCTTTIDLRTIPPWQPSPNNDAKRRVAEELRREIEGQWRGAKEIVIRDFSLEDHQITMYVKMPDGDYFQGCGFHANREPHCEGWHLFGMAPVEAIRRWIFERPYRLK